MTTLVLESRALECLRSYGFAHDTLTAEEMAAEIVEAVLPTTDAEYDDWPLWRELVEQLGVCTNCMCNDCGCCVGCGDTDADIIGSHGYGCTL